jgi:hypothetical protein
MAKKEVTKEIKTVQKAQVIPSEDFNIIKDLVLQKKHFL